MVCQFDCLSVCLSACLTDCLSDCLTVCLSDGLTACLPVRRPVCSVSDVCQSECLSTFQSVCHLPTDMYMYVHVCTCMYMCVWVHTCVCVCVCVCACARRSPLQRGPSYFNRFRLQHDPCRESDHETCFPSLQIRHFPSVDRVSASPPSVIPVLGATV